MSVDEPVETDRLLGRSIDVDEYHDAEDDFHEAEINAEKQKKEPNDGEKETPSSALTGGVKPKVRMIEETKKRRRVLQKAHSLAHVIPFSQSSGSVDGAYDKLKKNRRMSIDSFHGASYDSPPVEKDHTEELQETNCAENRREEEPQQRRPCPEFFGVKSYLHTFYDSVSIGSPNTCEDLGESDYRYLIAPSGKRRTACLWRAAFFLGINLLAFGLVMILVGYLVPKRNMVVGHEEDMEIIDKTALKFNKNLDTCKLAGLVVFCLGGTILVAVLLFPSLVHGYCEEETAWNASEAFRVRVGSVEEPPESTTDTKIPATEELTSVQPKREIDEEKMVMTNAGLCKVP